MEPSAASAVERVPLVEKIVPPGGTIGILGGGQLGRMLAAVAAEIGLNIHVYNDDPASPAFAVAGTHTVAGFDDAEELRRFARTVDVITYEFENVPVAAAEVVEKIAPVRPGKAALAASQDRLVEKKFLSDLGIPVAPFAAIDREADLGKAIGSVGLPAFIKTRRLGYDGKGQARIGRPGDAASALAAMRGAPAIIEGAVAFAREVSIIAVRGANGETAFYDMAENVHVDGILRTSRVPARIAPDVTLLAEGYARRVLDALGYIGVLAIEFFHCPNHETTPLIANEIAPRVHNSGHWTQDGSSVCQFENHVRAVAGWPLGTTRRHSDVRMINLIGAEAGNWAELAARSDARLHLYGKREARPGRKMGHVNEVAPRRTD